MVYRAFLLVLQCVYQAAVLADDDIPSRPTELTRSQADALVEAHNYYRTEVRPSGSNIRQLTWSHDLADQAQAFVSRCVFEHEDPYTFGEFGTIGENLFISSGKLETNKELTQAVTQWNNERDNYDIDTNECAPGKVCGHYTQLVWDTTYKVGCGITRCKNDVVAGGTTLKTPAFLACRYGPAGNIKPLFSLISRRPYSKGPSCSDCPGDAPDCLNNLCHADPARSVTSKFTDPQLAAMSNSPAMRLSNNARLTAVPNASLRCHLCQGEASAEECIELKQSAVCGETGSASPGTSWVCATYSDNGMVKMGCLFDSQCEEVKKREPNAQCCSTDLCNTGNGVTRPSTPFHIILFALTVIYL